MTKSNLVKGIPWQFGPNWPGERCGAKTRKGTPCLCPAKQPVGRCRLHGGASTGPRTKDGIAKLSEARTTHGKYTKAKRDEAKLRAEQGRKVRAELKEIESWSVDHCHLDKKWNDWFILKYY